MCRVVQTPGEFVVTFPHAYHASLHTGFGLAESACIAPLEWLPFGLASCTRALQLGRGCMLPREELLCAQAMELRGTTVLWIVLCCAHQHAECWELIQMSMLCVGDHALFTIQLCAHTHCRYRHAQHCVPEQRM